MADKKLHVRAKPGVLVMDPHAMAGGMHRYIGMRPKLEPVESPLGRADFFEVIPEGVKLPEDSHIRLAVKAGELEALDEWTAMRCRVEFKKSSK